MLTRRLAYYCYISIEFSMNKAYAPSHKFMLAVMCLLLVASGCRKAPEGQGESAGGPALPPNSIELVFTYGSEKEKWIKDVTDSFNASNAHLKSGKSIHVSQFAMGSGECIDELLTGKRKAHITSPASAAFIKLGNAKYRTKTGK